MKKILFALLIVPFYQYTMEDYSDLTTAKDWDIINKLIDEPNDKILSEQNLEQLGQNNNNQNLNDLMDIDLNDLMLYEDIEPLRSYEDEPLEEFYELDISNEKQSKNAPKKPWIYKNH